MGRCAFHKKRVGNGGLTAPSLASLAGELAQSCLRLATTLDAVGAEDEARELLMRVEAVLRGPPAKRSRP